MSDISLNVLGVCDANSRFLYVLPGWEGYASDVRVLRAALQRYNGKKVYTDHYYIMDPCYNNGLSFLAPYRVTRYHLKELEGRWGILRSARFYSVKTQIKIINACCILHNFVRREMHVDSLLDEVDKDLTGTILTEDDNFDDQQIRYV
ncbi:hypothetical protein PHJA_002709100 [Phtheirospermum japonicum]|uniref:DDE Tnp4 domain-containing protein n=1 Tax=Phtheirospermum japonicum TaxID=374723 RepID=A0A830D2Z4_9LAMI|nr:hypothetical protein PHJA_002709100 [Phtheirospermum japonicum]